MTRNLYRVFWGAHDKRTIMLARAAPLMLRMNPPAPTGYWVYHFRKPKKVVLIDDTCGGPPAMTRHPTVAMAKKDAILRFRAKEALANSK